MSGVLKINKQNGPPVKCHLMPVEIDFQGPASVNNHFETTISKSSDSSDTLEASFRGRPLKGQQVKIPQGYFGAVLQRKNNTLIESVSEFNELYYWKYDEEPSQADPLPSSLDWFLVSSALHESTSKKDNNH